MTMISVVIPAYNCARSLSRALESALLQLEPGDEVIVIDDGSSDDTAQVAARFAGKIKYIYQPNAGPAAARNSGVGEARGEWIAFLDADDYWLPGKLGLQKKLILKYPEAALFCGGRVEKEGEAASSVQAESAATDILPLERFIKHNSVNTSTVVMRKDVFMRLGGFDTSFSGPEDFDLWMRVAKERAVIYIDTPLSFYRSAPGSLSMDDRSFLPQALRLLDKAFGRAGALSAYAGRKPEATANQYVHASWMAFQRGSKNDALRHLFAAFKFGWRYGYIDMKCLRFLARFTFGPNPGK